MLQTKLFAAFFLYCSVMRQKLFCKIFISILSIALFAVHGCNSPKNSGSKRLYLQDNDSISYYLSETNSTSESNYISNLEKAFSYALKNTNDSLKSAYFSDLALAYLTLNDSALFRKSNRMALQFSTKIRDSISMANNHWDLASFFSDYAVEDSTYYHYSEAEKIFRSLNDSFYSARMLYNMAIIQSAVKDYIGSEINTIKAIELFKPLNKYDNLYYCYNNLGSLSNALKDYDRALEYYDLAHFYLNKFDPKSELKLSIYNNEGMVYQQMGQYNKASELFKKIIDKDSIYIKNIRFYGTALSNYAYSQSKLAHTTGVIDKFNQALSIKDSLNDIRGLAFTNYQIADYLLSQGDSIKALEYAKTSQAQAKQTSNNLRVLEVLALLGRIDPANATKYIQEYIKLNDSLIHEERTIQNKFTRIRFETDQFIEQNELLTRQRQLWIGIAGAAIALGVLTIMMIDQRRKNQKLRFEQVQQKNNQEVFNLLLAQNSKIEEGKQLEKKRISEELHDGILGQMLGIRLILSGLNNKTDDDSVLKRSELLKKLQQLEEEIRTISHELSKASQEKINNFIVSIRELVQTIEDSSKIKCHFKFDDRLDWDQLKADIKINVYRIIQESLQNCIKHAKATEVDVVLEYTGKQLDIMVADNGTGFNMKKGRKGIGLKNINSRLEKLNGTYDIQSQIGKGTKVVASIPYIMNEQNGPKSA